MYAGFGLAAAMRWCVCIFINWTHYGRLLELARVGIAQGCFLVEISFKVFRAFPIVALFSRASFLPAGNKMFKCWTMRLKRLPKCAAAWANIICASIPLLPDFVVKVILA